MASAEKPHPEKGQEVCITIQRDNAVALNLPQLWNVLCRPDCIDKKVAVISMTGNHRTGKSFILNYMLRNLRARGQGNWLGEPDVPLEGFQWGGGIDRVTEGVWVWSHTLPVQMSNGEEGVVLLLDTEDLVLLIRNWKNEEDFEFGWDGGAKYWGKIWNDLEASNDISAHKSIKSSFHSLRSYLLPPIGPKADGKKTFNGALSGLDAKFVSLMDKFICSLLNEMCPKRSGSMPITCGELYQLCVGYDLLFTSSDLPDLRSIDEANAQIQLISIRGECEMLYFEELDKAQESQQIETLDQLETINSRLTEEALDRLRNTRVSCADRIRGDQLERLTEVLDRHYQVIYGNLKLRLETEAFEHDRNLVDQLVEMYRNDMRLELGSRTLFDNMTQLEAAHTKVTEKVHSRINAESKSMNKEFRGEMKQQLEARMTRIVDQDRKEVQAKFDDEENRKLFDECKQLYGRTMIELRGGQAYGNETALTNANKHAGEKTLDTFNNRYHGTDKKEVMQSLLVDHMETGFRNSKDEFENHRKNECDKANREAFTQAQEEFLQAINADNTNPDGARTKANSIWTRQRRGSPEDWQSYEANLTKILNDLERSLSVEKTTAPTGDQRKDKLNFAEKCVKTVRRTARTTRQIGRFIRRTKRLF